MPTPTTPTKSAKPVPAKATAPAASPAAAKKPAFPTVTVLGRLGNDPDLKTVGDNVVCEFSLAEDVYTGAKDAEGKAVKTTVWYKVAAWNGMSDRAQYLAKGQEVVVRGGLKVTQGEKREFRDISANVIRLASPMPEPAQAATEEPDF